MLDSGKFSLNDTNCCNLLFEASNDPVLEVQSDSELDIGHRKKSVGGDTSRGPSATTGGGGLGPHLRNLEGNPPKRGPTMGETDKEGWIGVYKQQEHVCLVRTLMAYLASTATPAQAPTDPET